MTQTGHIKIALTSNSLTRVDCAFVMAKQILLYEVSVDSAELLDAVRFAGGGKGGKGGEGRGGKKKGGSCWMEDEAASSGVDRLTPRVEAIKDCQVIFTTGLSDVAAVKLRDYGVFPVKMESGREVDECIAYLQRMMKGNPPLWLRKAMGVEKRNAEFLLEPAAPRNQPTAA
ncbi:MAG: NifB/NifX family molybdenum-iron cluster-binding protein [Methylococcus sp.]|nr:NifB/NifX family molybdenum-iron cluster-binding protein [Methylococcus sp.]